MPLTRRRVTSGCGVHECVAIIMPRLPLNGIDWSNEKTLHFLELLAAETVIWDPKHRHHKIKQKVAEAWLRLQGEMNHPVEYLKSKKKSLMATFRPLINKKKSSLQSMLTDDDVFRPSWFAYEAMESFLGPLYFEDGYEEANTSQDASVSSDILLTPQQKPCRQVFVDVKSEPCTDRTSRQIKDTINHSDNVQRKHQKDEEDECDWYGKLLAKKLRKLPENERALFMYEIDGIFVNRLRNINSSRQNKLLSGNIATKATNSAACACQGEREQQGEDQDEVVEQIQQQTLETTIDHSDYYKKY